MTTRHNAEVDYVDAETWRIIETASFYDPGLDPNSQYTREAPRRIGGWRGLHLAYNCGRLK